MNPLKEISNNGEKSTMEKLWEITNFISANLATMSVDRKQELASKLAKIAKTHKDLAEFDPTFGEEGRQLNEALGFFNLNLDNPGPDDLKGINNILALVCESDGKDREVTQAMIDNLLAD